MIGRAATTSRLLLALAAVLAVHGCQATGTGEPQAVAGDAKVVWQSAHCGVTMAGARVVEGTEAVDRIVERAQRAQLGGSNPAPPRIEFEARRAVLVALGEKPTPGYAVEPAPDGFTISSGQARLVVEVSEPSANAAQAQVMTSPCTLITLPRAGYSTLVVQDPKGDQLARLTID